MMRLSNISSLLALFMLSSIAGAQTQPSTQPQENREAIPSTQPGARGGMMMQRLRNALDQLQLNDDQKQKVDQTLADARQRLQDLRADAQAGGSQMREKFQTIMQDMRQQLRAILTPEQLQKLRSLMPPPGEGGGGGGGFRQQQNSPPPSTQPMQHTDASPPLSGLRAGQKAPDFALHNLDGPTVQLSSFKGKIVLLVFGSYSSPIFRQHAAAIQQLRNEYVPRINPMIVYTRENYPAGDWDIERNKAENISIAQPSDMSGRIAAAKEARDKLELSMPILMDSMDDKTATEYDGLSNAAVLIGRDGNVLFFQKWFEPYALRAAIDAALKS